MAHGDDALRERFRSDTSWSAILDQRLVVRHRARAVAIHSGYMISWWAWAVFIAGVAAAVPVFAQPSTQASPVPGMQGPAQGTAPQGPVPEVIRPSGGVGGQSIPSNGVISPPAPSGASTTVIKPPATGTMPVIHPPGSVGGPGGVVPK